MSFDLSELKLSMHRSARPAPPRIRHPAALLAAAAAITWVALSAAVAFANPDVWVRAGVTYRLEEGKLRALGFEWRFDPYFSDRQIRSFDADADGRFRREEVIAIREAIFDPLGSAGHHVHVWIGERKRDDLEVSAFEASVEDRRLVLRFEVMLEPPADPSTADIVSSLHDDKTYIDFRLFDAEFLRVTGPVTPGCKFRVGPGRGAHAGHAQTIRLSCSDQT